MAQATISKYGNCLPKLCGRCGWTMMSDITPPSFCAWRAHSGLNPKSVNDLLGAASSFLNWVERNRLIVANPLKFVGKVKGHSDEAFRRALSIDQTEKLLSVSPFHRAVVYVTVLYTGLRRA